MNTDYITIVEAADEIGVSVREMQRKAKAGVVPAVKRAGAWWILRQDLDAARESHERGAGRPAASLPSDDEMEAMFAAAEAEQAERDAYFAAHGTGSDSPPAASDGGEGSE